jgi:hypothetical protein
VADGNLKVEISGDVMRKPYTWRARLVRIFALDRNQLRRRSDRIEAWFLLGLVITFVPLAPVAAISTARWAQADGTRELAAKMRLTPVTAVLARGVPAVNTIAPVSILLMAPARWTADGVRHTGAVPAVPGTKAGTSVGIWIDVAGKVQQPPLTSSQLSARVVLAAVGAPLAIALGMLFAWSGLRWLLNRHRLAAWGQSWSMTGPSWTR